MDKIRDSYNHTCVPFYEDSTLTDVYIAFSLGSFIIPFITLFASFWEKEFFTLLFSIGSAINWSVNFILKDILLKDRVPFKGCNDSKYGMPSLETQQAFFVAVFLQNYMIYWRESYNGSLLRKIFMLASLYLYCIIVAAGQAYLGSNTPIQTVIGSVSGIIFAHLYYLFILKVIVPRKKVILRWKIIKLLGYKDNMMYE